MGKAYASKPSSWFPDLGEIEALALDLECIKIGVKAEDEERRHQEARSRLR